MRLGGHADVCVCVCWGIRDCLSAMPACPKVGQILPHTPEATALLCLCHPTAGFLFRPGDCLKPLPPLSRLHCPLKIPHSAVAHTAVLERKGKSVWSWEPLSGFGAINVINNPSPLSRAQERARIQSSRLSPP